MSIILIIFIISPAILVLLLYQAPVVQPQKSTTPVSADDTSLAILISNRDLSYEEITKVLQDHGYKSYEDGCAKLAAKGQLVYVPTFHYNGIVYGGHYTTKSTILYHTALEAGIIKE